MLEYSDDMLKKLEKQLAEHKANCVKKASVLTACRKAAAEKLEARICSELRDLSMPSVRFKVSVEPMESALGFDKTGADEVQVSYLRKCRHGAWQNIEDRIRRRA